MQDIFLIPIELLPGINAKYLNSFSVPGYLLQTSIKEILETN